MDLETAPLLSWTWGRYEQNVIDVEKNWYILSFAYKWRGGEIKVHTNQGHGENDKELVRKLWNVFNEADIIVAHNAKAFDIKKANARFIFHRLKPPKPYKTIDTLLIARKYFKFDSNRLNDLAQYFSIGQKVKHTGFGLWKGCMMGDRSAWRFMAKYNAQDVLLLERVYLKLRAWDKGHPDLTLYAGKKGCPTCKSNNLVKNGRDYGYKTIRQQYICRNCGAYSSGKPSPRLK